MQAGGERPMEKAQDLKNSQAEGWTVDCNYGVFPQQVVLIIPHWDND